MRFCPKQSVGLCQMCLLLGLSLFMVSVLATGPGSAKEAVSAGSSKRPRPAEESGPAEVPRPIEVPRPVRKARYDHKETTYSNTPQELPGDSRYLLFRPLSGRFFDVRTGGQFGELVGVTKLCKDVDKKRVSFIDVGTVDPNYQDPLGPLPIPQILARYWTLQNPYPVEDVKQVRQNVPLRSETGWWDEPAPWLLDRREMSPRNVEDVIHGLRRDLKVAELKPYRGIEVPGLKDQCRAGIIVINPTKTREWNLIINTSFFDIVNSFADIVCRPVDSFHIRRERFYDTVTAHLGQYWGNDDFLKWKDYLGDDEVMGNVATASQGHVTR